MTPSARRNAGQPRIVLTGATGFIGRRLAVAANAAGFDVFGLSRSGAMLPGLTVAKRWSLGEGVPRGITADVIVHLAHDFSGDDGAERSRLGTERVFNEFRNQGVSRQIFVSSYSAGPHATSRYGQVKSAIERTLSADPTVVIVRPGLVLGDAGIYGRMVAFAQRFPIVPLPDGGNGKVPVISEERLCSELIDLCMTSSPPKYANLFHNEKPDLRSLILAAAAEVGRKPAILPVPMNLALPMMRCIELIGLSPPVSSDSLVGFAKNQIAQHVSTLKE